MTYLYSGNNDAVGAIELALKKRQAELNAIVGRVSDISQNITDTAQQSSQRGNDVANILGTASLTVDSSSSHPSMASKTVPTNKKKENTNRTHWIQSSPKKYNKNKSNILKYRPFFTLFHNLTHILYHVSLILCLYKYKSGCLIH